MVTQRTPEVRVAAGKHRDGGATHGGGEVGDAAVVADEEIRVAEEGGQFSQGVTGQYVAMDILRQAGKQLMDGKLIGGTLSEHQGQRVLVLEIPNGRFEEGQGGLFFRASRSHVHPQDKNV